MPPILDGLPEGLARLESRDLLSPYPHRLSGLGVPTFPRLLLPDVELPEARQLDLLARLERFRYGRGERFQVFFGLALGGVGVLYHPLYEPLLVHGCLTPCSMVFTLRVLPSAGGRANTRDAAIIFRRTPLGRSSAEFRSRPKLVHRTPRRGPAVAENFLRSPRARRICATVRDYAIGVASGSNLMQQKLLPPSVHGSRRCPPALRERVYCVGDAQGAPFLCRIMNFAELAFCEVRGRRAP